MHNCAFIRMHNGARARKRNGARERAPKSRTFNFRQTGAPMRISLKTSFAALAICALCCLSFRAAWAQATGTQATAPKSPQVASNAGPAVATATAPDVSGEWRGTIQTSGGVFRLVLKLTRQAAGQLTATLDSLDQHVTDLPLGNVTYADRILRFELAAGTPAVFEGVASRDGTEISGTWNQGGALPLRFTRTRLAAEAPATTMTTPPVTANPRRRVQLQPCALPDWPKDYALCGQYEVFENRAAKSGRKIKLNLLVLPALSAKPAPDPIFYLAGGPGGAATSYVDAPFMLRMHQTHDVVLLDQRGTGQSNPLRCDFRGDPNNMSGYFADGMTVEAVRACRTELEKVADLRLYTTPIAMGDLDEVRDALGYDKVNVYGGSYGSTAALAYLHLYPQHVRTVTVLGVAPLDFKLPLPFGRGIDHALERLFADCEADAKCRGAFPDVRKEFAAVVARLDKAPATFETLNPFTGKKQQVTMTRDGFAEDIRLLLYVPDVMSALPAIIHQMYGQNYALFGTVAYQVFRQIDGGTFYGETRARSYVKACEQWPRGEVPANFFEPIKSDTPVLMLSGELDPVTPPDAAASLLKGLTNARQVRMHNATHNSYDCAEGLAREFIARGTAQGLDASCVEQIKRPPFDTSLPSPPMPK
jgi:pimeloyl-ACP methyl ester carboxylesterase